MTGRKLRLARADAGHGARLITPRGAGGELQDHAGAGLADRLRDLDCQPCPPAGQMPPAFASLPEIDMHAGSPGIEGFARRLRQFLGRYRNRMLARVCQNPGEGTGGNSFLHPRSSQSRLTQA